MPQHFVLRPRAGDLVEAPRASCRSASTNSSGAAAAAASRARAERVRARSLEQRRCGACSRSPARSRSALAAQRARRCATQLVDALAGQRRHARCAPVRRVRPTRHEIALARHHDRGRAARRLEQRAIVGVERLRCDRARRAPGPRPPRAWRARAMPSSSIGVAGALAQAGGVDQRHRHAVDVDALGQQIARRAGHLGDDRARGAGERVEEARLARVRPADDDHRQPFANHPAARARPRAARRASAMIASIARAAASGSMK